MVKVLPGAIGAAQQQGLVQPAAADILARQKKFDCKDLGVGPDAIETDKATIVTFLLDNSWSIQEGGHTGALIKSYNRGLEVIRDADSAHDIIVGAMALSGYVIRPYQHRHDATKLSRESFVADLNYSPIWRQTVKLCGMVKSKQGQFVEAGIPTRTMTCLLTDGDNRDDEGSLSDAQIAVDALQQGYKSKIYGIGLGSCAISELSGMGVPTDNLFPAGNEQQLQKAFEEFSQATSAAM